MTTLIIANVCLALMWCLLSEKFELGTFVAGNIVAAIVLWIFRRVHGAEATFLRRALRLRKAGVLLKLIGFFTYELIKSNLQVAWLIWQPRLKVHSALIRLPTILENDLSITMLANMISLTPGTVTMDVAEDRKSLIVHCLNVSDIEGTKRVIKERFEAPLRELEQ